MTSYQYVPLDLRTYRYRATQWWHKNVPPPWHCAFCGEPVSFLGGSAPLSGMIHHIDEDGRNNDPANLAIVHYGCHTRHHSTGRPVSQETREKISRANKGRPCSPETREKLRQAALRQHGKLPT